MKTTNPDRVGDWIQVYSGGIFYPLDPRPEEINLIDIAHSLSMKCRYAGHTKEFYSVAEHSVLISQVVSKRNALWGLLHDAPEAFSSDCPKPLKRCLPQWKAMERRIMDAVCVKFGLEPPEPEEVREADNRILADERALLMNPCQYDWGVSAPLGVHIFAHCPKVAEFYFMQRFREIILEMGVNPK